MAKAAFLIFVGGPAMLGFSLGWLVHHPGDWTGPATLAPIGTLLTFVTYRWGRNARLAVSETGRTYLDIGMISGALTGVAIFAMLALRLIG